MAAATTACFSIARRQKSAYVIRRKQVHVRWPSARPSHWLSVRDLPRDVPRVVLKDHRLFTQVRVDYVTQIRRSLDGIMFTVFRILLILIHFSCDLFAAVYNCCMILHRKCTEIWYGENVRTEIEILTRTASRMKKLPRHIVIIFGAKEDTIFDCIGIIGWCIALGVPYISFFDISGNIDFCLLLII